MWLCGLRCTGAAEGEKAFRWIVSWNFTNESLMKASGRPLADGLLAATDLSSFQFQFSTFVFANDMHTYTIQATVAKKNYQNDIHRFIRQEHCIVVVYILLGLVVGAWKRGWTGRLGKVVGNFDGWGCLGKVLARLHGGHCAGCVRAVHKV